MHYLVKLIVKADTAEEALQQAESDADTMVEYGYCDWYNMDGRWGTSKAYGVNTKKGKELIKEGMDENRYEFDRAMAAIRYMMENYNDDEIYNENFTQVDQKESEFYLSRYQFTVASGKSNAGVCYAMDGDLWGSRIDNDKDLGHVLAHDAKLWVVPVDVHN